MKKIKIRHDGEKTLKMKLRSLLDEIKKHETRLENLLGENSRLSSGNKAIKADSEAIRKISSKKLKSVQTELLKLEKIKKDIELKKADAKRLKAEAEKIKISSDMREDLLVDITKRGRADAVKFEVSGAKCLREAKKIREDAKIDVKSAADQRFEARETLKGVNSLIRVNETKLRDLNNTIQALNKVRAKYQELVGITAKNQAQSAYNLKMAELEKAEALKIKKEGGNITKKSKALADWEAKLKAKQAELVAIAKKLKVNPWRDK